MEPRWEDERKKTVLHFLNPEQQDKYEAGWYTLKELKLWAKDKGPVLKKQS